MSARNSFLLLLFLVLASGFAVRLPFLSLPLFEDNSLRAFAVERFDAAGHNVLAIPHVPLSQWPFIFSKFVFGDMVLSLRLVPILFSILIAAATALFARRLYGDDATALLSAFLVLFSSLGFVSSIIIESDNTLLTFLLVGLFWAAYEYVSSGKPKWLAASAAVFCMLVLTKLQSVLFFLPVAAYVFFSSKKSRTIAFSASLLLGGAFAAFLFAAMYLAQPGAWPAVSSIVFGHDFNSYPGSSSVFDAIASKFSGALPLAVGVGPLLVGLTVLFLVSRRGDLAREKRDPLLWWLAGIFLSYFVVLPGMLGADLVRFYSVFLPPLAVFSARFLVLNRRLVPESAVAFASVVFAGVLALVNSLFPSAAYSWYNISATLVGSRISFVVLALAAVSITVPFLLVFRAVLCKRPMPRLALAAFLSVSLGFGFFVAACPVIQPEYSQAVSAAVTFMKTSPISGNFFAWNEASAFYGGRDYSLSGRDFPAQREYARLLGYSNSTEYVTLCCTPAAEIDRRLSEGGTVVFITYPIKYAERNPAYATAVGLVKKHCRSVARSDFGEDAYFQAFSCPIPK